MNPKHFVRSRILTLMALIALTSACGKNLSVVMGNADGTATEKPASTIDTTKDGINGGVKVDLVGKKAGTTAANDVARTNVLVIDAVEEASLDGKLHPYSKFDLADPTAKRLFANEGPYATRVIGMPAVTDKDNGIGFVKASNVVFRAILQVPAKKDIRNIKKFELVLAGLRLFDAKGSGLAKKALTDQILCIAETDECSGKGKKTEVFSSVELKAMIDYKEQGAVFENNSEVTLDMIKLFGLEKLSQAELADWIYANSTEYATTGYRKFRFVMGNNVFVEAGELILELSATNVAKADQGAPINGATDGETPDAGTAPEVMGSASDAAATAEEATVTQAAGAEVKSEAAAPADASTATETQTSTADEVAPPMVGSAWNGTTEPGAVISPEAQTALDSLVNAPAAAPAADAATPEAEPATAPDAPFIRILKKEGVVSLQMNLDDLHLTFDHDKTTISKASKKKLAETAAILKKFSDSVAKVKIVGRTDKTGSADYNLDLSSRRADAVATVLVTSGVNNKSIAKKGVGEPKASSCAPSQPCRKDRRVDIRFDFAKGVKESRIHVIRSQIAKIWKLSVVK